MDEHLEQEFFITKMPFSRRANYYLGFMEGAVFIDFNKCGRKLICLRRISFDGYGCYNINREAVPLNETESLEFKTMIKSKIIDQPRLLTIVKKTLRDNRHFISQDALDEYGLI